MDWQPISTAPKDGTIVDLWVDGERLANCFWGYDWDEPEDRGWQQRYAEASSSFAIEGKPTYWMPLPEPPKE